MFTFPSLEWFQELARLMNENEEAFKRLGYADVTWAVHIQPSSPAHPDQLFRFVFEEYSCLDVQELDPGMDADADFTMQASDGPDLEHTLNRLTLMDHPIYIQATDFLSRDLFARYGQTFQLFFNGAFQIQTDFIL